MIEPSDYFPQITNNNLKQQVLQLMKFSNLFTVQLEQECTIHVMETTSHANTSGYFAKLATHNNPLQCQLDTMEEMQ